MTTPTVVNDRVYLTRGKSTDNAPVATLEAYDLETGKPQWSSSLDTTFTFGAPLFDLRPIYHDGVLYVNVDERFINDPPVVTDDAIYGAGLNSLICFEHDGSERWEFAPDGHMNYPSTPAVLDGTVYTVTDRTLVALDADSGEQLWTGESGEVMSNVIATENEIVQAGIGVQVFEPDGTERWAEDTTQKASIRPAVDDETVYCADLDGNVLARELSSGDLRWQRTLPEQEWSQGTIPVVTDRAVNLHRTNGEKTTVYALNAEDGKTKWKISKKGTRSRGPILARDTVVFTTQYTPPKQRESKTVSDGLDTTSQLWTYDI